LQRYFIQLSYNGTAYHGWQVQENTDKTIQHCINHALSKILNECIAVTGCGRTDTGVHATNFYAHFDSTKNDLTDENKRLVLRLNQVLPPDIAVQKIIHVKAEAHSRFDAVSRTYHYYTTKFKDPFKINTACFLYGDYDIEKMNLAALELFNYNDFSAFSKSHTQTATNNCKIMEAKWHLENNNLVFTIKADRFLRNMVRAIVGTLLEIGKGKITINEFKTIIESKERSNAGTSVPACGLYLTKVEYPTNYFTQS
jgi:tRNA pseudouridine38-40 synthase